jgi:hypothetical protein
MKETVMSAVVGALLVFLIIWIFVLPKR